MDTEKKRVFTARVAQANRSELVVVMYEIILDSIDSATEAYQKGDTQEADRELERAKGILQELRGSLDFQYPLSFRLRQLYRYVWDQFTATLLQQKPVNLDSCQNVLRGLLVGFEQMAREDHSESVMENTQQVYAGLTYGKNSLNEVCLQEQVEQRGFQA